MAKKKKLIVAVIVISLFAVMSLCGMAVAGQQAMDRSDFHGSEDNVIDRAAIIDEENSMLVGKEVEDTTPLTATKGMKGTPGIVQDRSAKIKYYFYQDTVAETMYPTTWKSGTKTSSGTSISYTTNKDAYYFVGVTNASSDDITISNVSFVF